MTDAYGLYFNHLWIFSSTPPQTLFHYVAEEPNEHWNSLLTEVWQKKLDNFDKNKETFNGSVNSKNLFYLMMV